MRTAISRNDLLTLLTHSQTHDDDRMPPGLRPPRHNNFKLIWPGWLARMLLLVQLVSYIKRVATSKQLLLTEPLVS